MFVEHNATHHAALASLAALFAANFAIIAASTLRVSASTSSSML